MISLKSLNDLISTLDPVVEEEEEVEEESSKDDDKAFLVYYYLDMFEATFYDFVWGHEIGTGSFSKVKL